MSDSPTEPRRTELASRLLVAVLGGMFLLGLLGFVAAVFNAREEGPAIPAAPELPAMPTERTPAASSAISAAEPRAEPRIDLPALEQVAIERHVGSAAWLDR